MTNQTNSPEKEADGTLLIRFFYRYRKIYLIVFLVSILGGLGVSLLLTPRYYSYAILFPVYNSSIESVVDAPVFGYDVEADRLLQVLYSEEVFDSCAAKFNLYQLMDVDSNTADARDELKEKFYDEVSFGRSQYVSVVISANTPDPQLSADMVNYIIRLSDGIRNRIYKNNLYIVYKALEGEYKAKRNQMDLMSDSVTALRMETSIEVLTMMSNQVVLKSNNATTSKEQTNLERLLNNYLFEQSRLNDLSERYMKAKTQYERPATQAFVLQYAKPSYKVRTPDHVINMLISVLCALVFLTGFLLMREKLMSMDLHD